MVHEEHDGLTELEALVAEGLELETADRETWLDTLSEHSAELGDEVRARLRLLGELGWSRASDPAEPRRLGRFVLVERIGLGGMGEVWRAEDGERTVAIKLVRPELLWFEGARRRFQREIQAVSALDHSGIVRVLEVGDADGVPWMALEWIDGLSLESLIELLRHRPPDSVTPAELLEPLVALAYVPGAPEASAPPPSERTYPEFVAGLLAHVAEALEHAHARGVIHRDVKPSNILVTARAHTWLADFGLAFSREGSRLTRTGSWLGSLPYASPEQVEGKGELDERADVYSLGATLYEALTLRTPFLGGSESSVRARVLAGDLPPVRHWNPGVPRSLELVCAKAMDRDPARRYAGAAELARDLRNVAEGRAVRARALPPWLRVARAARRRPRLTVVLLAAVVVVATLAAWGLRERHLNQQVRRMADTELMARLERDSLALLPIDARRLPLIEDWLARARDLLARSELHAAELEDLRAAALPHDDRQAVEDAAPARARLLELRLEVEGLGHFLETRSSREDLPLPLEAQRVQVAHEHWSEQLRDAPDDFLDEFLARIAGLRSFAAGHTVPSAAELDQLDAFEAAVREHEALLDQSAPTASPASSISGDTTSCWSSCDARTGSASSWTASPSCARSAGPSTRSAPTCARAGRARRRRSPPPRSTPDSSSSRRPPCFRWSRTRRAASGSSLSWAPVRLPSAASRTAPATPSARRPGSCSCSSRPGASRWDRRRVRPRGRRAACSPDTASSWPRSSSRSTS